MTLMLAEDLRVWILNWKLLHYSSLRNYHPSGKPSYLAPCVLLAILTSWVKAHQHRWVGLSLRGANAICLEGQQHPLARWYEHAAICWASETCGNKDWELLSNLHLLQDRSCGVRKWQELQMQSFPGSDPAIPLADICSLFHLSTADKLHQRHIRMASCLVHWTTSTILTNLNDLIILRRSFICRLYLELACTDVAWWDWLPALVRRGSALVFL